MKNPSSIPSSWSYATIGEIANIGAGGPAPQNEADFSNDGTLFVRVQDLGRLESKIYVSETVDRITQDAAKKNRLRLMPKGTVLFTKSGMSTLLNQRGILARDAYVVSHIGVALPHRGILSSWLYWALKQTDLGALTQATTLPSLRLSRVTEVSIPIPPTSEQERIIAEIDKQFTRLDAAVAALKRIQANLKRYRAAVLKAACEGRLVPTEAELARREGRSYEPASALLEHILAERRSRWEAIQLVKFGDQGKQPVDDTWKRRYKEPFIANEVDLPKLPDGWLWVSVEALSTKVVDGVHKKPNYVPQGIPFVTVKNLTAGPGISFDDLHYVTEDDHREFIRRANPEENDLLITKDGTLGVIRKIRTKKRFSIFVSVAMIKPVLREMSDYLELALSAPQVQFQMVPKGSGLQHIHLEDLRQDCIPIPPLVEQSRITLEVARRISVIEEVDRELGAELKRAARLRQSILKSAFEGKLVPQNPADEPASILLERIRADRSAAHKIAPTTPRRRRKKEATHVSG